MLESTTVTMHKRIGFSGDVSIIKKYTKLLIKDGIKFEYDENDAVILRYLTLDGKLDIVITNRINMDINIVNCSKLDAIDVIAYVKKALVGYRHAPYIIIIHPTLSHVIIHNRFVKCIPFVSLRTVIEKWNMYEDYICIDETITENFPCIIDANDLSKFILQNPLITTCCQEEYIEYPDFIKIKSSDDIEDWMDSVMIDKNFIQTSDWMNITSVMFNGQKATMHNAYTDIDHICGIDFDNIDTLYINGLVGCNGDCEIACSNIVFVNQNILYVTDFCRVNASIIRFDHKCYAPNSDELIKNIQSQIEEIRSQKPKFEPSSVKAIESKSTKNMSSSKSRKTKH